MFKNLAKLIRGRDIQIRAVIITALCSYLLQLGGILLRWPLWTIALVTLLPWIPLFTMKVLWNSRHYGFMAIYSVLMLVQGGHVGEHVFQMGEYIFYKETAYQGRVRAIDTYLLDDPRTTRIKVTEAFPSEGNLFIVRLSQPITGVQNGDIVTAQAGTPAKQHTGQYVNFVLPDGRSVTGLAVVFPNCQGWTWNGPGCGSAHGVFGELDRELVHFLWDGIILIACFLLLLKFPKNPWTFWAFLAAFVHQIEHVYLFGASLDAASGYPGKGSWLGLAAQQVDAGLLGRNGWLGTLTGLDGYLNGMLPNRINLHFLYNTLVFIPMLGAFLYQVRRIYDEWLAKALPTLSREQLISFSSHAQPEVFGADKIIFKQGDAADRFYIITKGTVEISRSDKRGNVTPVATLGQGDYFGEIGILGRTRRTATAKTVTPVELLALDETTFRAMVAASVESHKEVDLLVRYRVKELAEQAGRVSVERKVDAADPDALLKSRILQNWLDDMESKSQLLNWNGLSEPRSSSFVALPPTDVLPDLQPTPNGVAVAERQGYGSLRVRSGPNAGERFELTSGHIVVGRRSQQASLSLLPVFMLDDSRVSREHLEILQQPSGVYVLDRGSSNGTWLNGKRLDAQPVPLYDGDELKLATDTVITYHAGF
jgi:CRP-like cAMP-binding protein